MKPSPGPTLPLNSRQWFALRARFLLERLREYLSFDSVLFRKTVAMIGVLAGFLLWFCGWHKKAISLWAKIHRADHSAWANQLVERWVRGGTTGKSEQPTRPLARVYQQHIEQLSSTPATAKFFEDPQRMLGARVLVLKSPRGKEKGVLLIDYSFTFPFFARMFDLQQIARRYYLVLEPSWSGYCDLDILCYSQFDFPVFVESYEPRDAAFIRSTHSNLIPVPVSTNWWVDHRVLTPLPEVQKEVDIIMIASWARFKRHYRLFAALASLRAQGERLRVVLVGYPVDYTLDDIHRQAKYYGVADQVEMYEWLSPTEVNDQLNRARVNVIWSRKEGVNRAIIEGMFADVPCVVREGFNYGYRYPYINPQTGCFATEREFPKKLLEMTRHPSRFSPRDWVMANMSPEKGTTIIGEAIKKVALEAGEGWTENLAVKVCQLNTMSYWNEDDKQRFAADYDFLRSMIGK